MPDWLHLVLRKLDGGFSTAIALLGFVAQFLMSAIGPLADWQIARDATTLTSQATAPLL